MNDMTSTTAFARVRTDHVQTLKTMIDGAGERPLNSLDRCDRCGAQAHSTFTVNTHETALKFCGRHTRIHLDSLLDLDLAGFWIDRNELFSVPELRVPWQGQVKAGDGLTDA